MRLVVITGPSGAGKTLALHSFEDAGYYTADNVPPPLLPALVHFCRDEGHDRAAVVVDARAGRAISEIGTVLDRMRRDGCETELLYLDAGDESLLRRYKETRRPHPLLQPGALLDDERHGDRSAANGAVSDIMDAIEAERTLLEPARAQADRVLDTSALTGAQLREAVHATYAAHSRPGLLVTVVSFGFKHGLPIDADLVFDVRFLQNPHYVPELKALDGRDPRVAAYVHSDARTKPFQEKMTDLVAFALPEYQQEGKAYLNIAIGCTGGQHRSVLLAEELAQSLRDSGYQVALRHRDVADTDRHSQTPNADASPPSVAPSITSSAGTRNGKDAPVRVEEAAP